MTNQNIRNLACAITLQAVRDYFDTTSSKKKATILKDLRSSWMNAITNGTSVIVAEQLELHPEEIAARLRQNHEMERFI
jgi:hypothetical protein